MSPADIAFLMNALWESLQAPGWTFSNRKDLEKLGEAIYSGKKLKEVDNQLLTRLFPHLKIITVHLGELLMQRSHKLESEHKAEMPSTQEPPVNPSETP